jgi:hypothetical protein
MRTPPKLQKNVLIRAKIKEKGEVKGAIKGIKA